MQSIYMENGAMWAYTPGNNSGFRYEFTGGINANCRFNSDATSILFHGESQIYPYSSYHRCWACWPSHTGFNIDGVLSCVGSIIGGRWGGIHYKSDSWIWDDSPTDYWVIKVITPSIESVPEETPDPSSYYLPLRTWVEWAYTTGFGGVKFTIGDATQTF
eukprot:284872_1